MAVSVSTSTSARSALIASLWRTPKRCSSSMISRPRRLNFTSLDSSLCVPTTMSMRAVGDALQRGVDLLRRAKARQLGHLHRPLAEAVDDVLEVLLGQQRGRRQQAPPACRRCTATKAARRATSVLPKPTSPQTSRSIGLGLTMSWITAWIAARWSGGLLEAEAGGEGLVVVRRVAVGVALARGAAGIQVEQFGGGVAHLLGGLALGLVPLARAQPVQRRLFGADAGVAADQVQLRHRHVQRGLVGVLEVQELRRPAVLAIGQVDVDQARRSARCRG